MSVLSELCWADVRAHYDRRVDVHQKLLRLHDAGPSEEFSRLLLGVSNASGNYSAAEHHLGPKILAENPDVHRRLHTLASELRKLTSARSVPSVIRAAGLSYLAIGVGSEASCLMNPRVCWVANTRSIWTHLVQKHQDCVGKADEELKLYRESDAASEMAYRMWAAIHGQLERSLTRVAERGAASALLEDVEPGEITFLWSDAISSALYAAHHG
jgi:hypothetical protein